MAAHKKTKAPKPKAPVKKAPAVFVNGKHVWAGIDVTGALNGDTRFLVTHQRARMKLRRLDAKLEDAQIRLLRFIWMRTVNRVDSVGFNSNELRPLFNRGYLGWTGTGLLHVTPLGNDVLKADRSLRVVK